MIYTRKLLKNMEQILTLSISDEELNEIRLNKGEIKVNSALFCRILAEHAEMAEELQSHCEFCESINKECPDGDCNTRKLLDRINEDK